MTVAKGALIAVGVAGGIYVLSRFMTSTKPVVGAAKPSNQTTDIVASAGAFLSNALGSVFKSNANPFPQPSAQQSVSPSGGGDSYITTESGSYGNVAAYNNYAAADASPGTALPAGVYGPTIPVDFEEGD